MQTVLKKRLNPKTLSFLKEIKRKLKLNSSIFILKIASRSYFLSSIYVFYNRTFEREHFAVINGKLNYYQDSDKFLLRRNIHRLEKGLLMIPRRKVFAKDYIGETVTSYKNMITSKIECEPGEIKWAHDVLVRYFNVVESDFTVDKYREIFNKLKHPDLEGHTTGSYSPYLRKSEDMPNIDFDEFKKLVEYRRSVRWYQDRQVPRELIDKAVEIASYSPSACNRQPFAFRVIDEPGLVRKVSSIPGGTKGYDHNIPVIVAVIGKLGAYFSERDRHVIYIDGSLAAMSFVYALELQGIGSCMINWPDVKKNEVKMKETLSLKDDERVVMLISLGYPNPSGMVAYSKKKSLEELRRYN